MIIRLTFARILCLSCAALLTSCSKPEPPKPDGTSGIEGICLLPADSPDKDGKIPDRKRWERVVVIVSHTNIGSNDPTWGREYRTTANSAGEYRLELNPGAYLVAVHDPNRLKNMAITPIVTKVEPGRF